MISLTLEKHGFIHGGIDQRASVRWFSLAFRPSHETGLTHHRIVKSWGHYRLLIPSHSQACSMVLKARFSVGNTSISE